MKEIDPNNTFVNLNFMCNNNCISCIREDSNKLLSDPDIFIVKKKIDKILSISNHIEFNGGEPTLRKDFLQILKYVNLRKRGVEIALLSNCRIFSDMANAKKILDLNLPRFKIVTSIYGSNPKLHDAITRTPHSFVQQIKGVKNLLQLGVNIDLRIIITKLNYKDLKNIADFIIDNFKPFNFIKVSLVNMKIYGISEKNSDFITYKVSDIMQDVESVTDLLSKAGFKVSLFHFPNCVLNPKYWKYSVGTTAEETEIVFPEFCEKCLKKEDCSGIWKGYEKIYGVSEFRPILTYSNTLTEREIFEIMNNFEVNRSDSLLLEAAKALFNDLDLKKIKIKEAFFSFYPVVQNEKGFCGTCLCEGGWGVLENNFISDFYINSNLEIVKGELKIPFRNNNKLLSLYTTILNSMVQIDERIVCGHIIPEGNTILNKECGVLTLVGFALHDFIDYTIASEINIIDRGLFLEKERVDESRDEIILLKRALGDKFKEKVNFFNSLDKDAIKRADIIMLSGSTISNGSVDEILKNINKDQNIIIWGRSTLLYPKIMFGRGVRMLRGSFAPNDLLSIAKNNYRKYIALGEPGENLILLDKTEKNENQ